MDAQNTQPNSPTPLNQPNNPIPLSQHNTPMQLFTGPMEHAQRTPLSEHVHRTSENIYEALNFISPSDLMKSSCGWMKACLIQHMFCSRESTIYFMIQQDEKSIQIYIRPIWDGSSASTKGLGNISDKGQELQEPLDIHS